jgi:hypothetical protein
MTSSDDATPGRHAGERPVQERIEEYAVRLRQAEADLAQAEQRARTLATEAAARATEFSERVRALVAERERAEERARALAEEVDALERRLGEAHVLPVFSPVETEPAATEPEQLEPAPARTAPASYAAKRGSGLVGLLAGLAALACAAAVGWLAYQGTMLDRVGLSIALTVGALLALSVALRRRAQSSEVLLDRGTLRLRFGDNHHTFYLNSPSTRLEMTGRPGDRDWKVQVVRRGMAPVTIDAKDVDPVAFTEALHQWRS